MLLLLYEPTQFPLQLCIELYETELEPDPPIKFRNCKPAHLSFWPPPIISTPENCNTPTR